MLSADRERHARWRAVNREKLRARSAAWREANQDKVRAYRAAYYRKHKAAIRAVLAAWAERNPERSRGRFLIWQRKNKDRTRAASARHRAALLRATPKWADHAAIAAVYAKAVDLGLEVDHIVPLQSAEVCGLHVHNNLQVLSRSENARKGNRSWPKEALA